MITGGIGVVWVILEWFWVVTGNLEWTRVVLDGLQIAHQTKVVFNSLHYYEGLTRGIGVVLGGPKVVLGSYEKTSNGLGWSWVLPDVLQIARLRHHALQWRTHASSLINVKSVGYSGIDPPTCHASSPNGVTRPKSLMYRC